MKRRRGSGVQTKRLRHHDSLPESSDAQVKCQGDSGSQRGAGAGREQEAMLCGKVAYTQQLLRMAKSAAPNSTCSTIFATSTDVPLQWQLLQTDHEWLFSISRVLQNLSMLKVEFQSILGNVETAQTSAESSGTFAFEGSPAIHL